MTLKSINPATGSILSEYAVTEPEVVDVRLQMAHETSCVWRATRFADRAARLQSLAAILKEGSDDLARLITSEMGKPIAQARAEVEKCGWLCEYYAEHASEFLAPRTEATSADRSYVRYDPLGTILAIMPWNFPFWQVFRCAAPAVMAGNVVVLKHASNVSGVALELERLFVRAEFPTGVFTTLLLKSDEAEALIGNPLIHAVTLTGSERAGRAVAAAAGQALKPSVLELGGSDPFIVLADADPVEAARRATQARCQNNGQSCIAAKRFLVEKPIVEKFLRAFVESMQSQQMGDPLDEQTDIGPLARPDLRSTLADQVARSLELGAELVCGEGAGREANSTDGSDCFYQPTVLTHVRPGMPVFDEETFGPVAAVTTVADRHEALELANHSSYGLGASIWTGQRAQAEELAAQLEAGCVFINEIVKSNPHMPFGGVKQSGYGRELSREGIRQFTNVKSVWAA